MTKLRYMIVTVQQVKTTKRSLVKRQFDPVEDKYVITAAFSQSVANTNLYYTCVAMCIVLVCIAECFKGMLVNQVMDIGILLKCGNRYNSNTIDIHTRTCNV